MDNEPPNKNRVLDYARPPAPRVPIYRRIMAGGMFLSGIALVICGAFLSNKLARVDMWTLGGGLVVMGVVIRFQHVRLC